MKKIIVLLVCCMLSVGLFAETVSSGNFGFTFSSLTTTVTVGGLSGTSHQTATAFTLDADWEFFAEDSRVGFDLGLFAMYPLSSKVDGYSIDVDFIDVELGPKVGVAWKTPINDTLTMYSAAGYQMLWNYDSEYVSGIGTVSSTLFVHGIYGRDCLLYKADGIDISFGVNAIMPLFGSQKLSASGYPSEKYTGTYSGIIFTPFVGFRIQK